MWDSPTALLTVQCSTSNPQFISSLFWQKAASGDDIKDVADDIEAVSIDASFVVDAVRVDIPGGIAAVRNKTLD